MSPSKFLRLVVKLTAEEEKEKIQLQCDDSAVLLISE